MTDQKTETNSNNKGGYFIQTLSVKREAVAEWQSQRTPVRDILKKYNIARATLTNWRKQVLKGSDPLIHVKRYSKEYKLRVVKSIATNSFSLKEAAEYYNLSATTIRGWTSKFSFQIEDFEEPMTKRKKEKNADTDRVIQLEKALEDANLKIIGLETMINIAEQDLRINIRKKSGTKQSK